SAAVLSPAASASSTLRTKVRTRERRSLLTAVLRSILRAAFLAEGVLAIVPLFVSLSVRAVRQGPPGKKKTGSQRPPRFVPAYSSALRARQRVFRRLRSTVPERGRPLLDEGGHAFLLVLHGEQGMEQPPFEAQAFGE